MLYSSNIYYSESDTSTSSAEANIGAGRLGAAAGQVGGGIGGVGGRGGGGRGVGPGGGGAGVGGRGVGQMAPMLKPRLGDMYQEESEAEGQFNSNILNITLIFAGADADNNDQ